MTARLTVWLAIALVTGLIAAAVAFRVAQRRAPARQVPVMSQTEKLAWQSGSTAPDTRLPVGQ
ncbi:hypothetical protein [Streptomyces sp. NPDC002521]